MCEKYFPNLIDFASGENESAGIKKKPSPDTVKKVLEHFGFENTDAVYVGDSEVDILTAKNSNIPCVSVSWGFKSIEFLKENGAQIIIDKPMQITHFLDD